MSAGETGRVGFAVPARPDPWPNFGLLALLVAAGGLVSGVFLALNYAPTLDAARDSVAWIEEQVALGRFLRGLHHWSGTFAIVLAALHGARLFWHGAYKAPRRPLWLLGGLIFLVLVGFGYTGYLLPGDERALTGLGVMEGVAAATPLAGDAAGAVVTGGAAVSSATLTRLYAIHAVLLPAALLALLAAFVAVWCRTGPARHHADTTQETKPAWPDAVLRDARAGLVVLLGLALLAAFAPPGLGPKPDLTGEGAGDARPEWFLLWVNELLQLVPGATFWIAAVVPGLLLALGLALPWIRSSEVRAPARRKGEIAAAGLLLLALAGLTASSLVRNATATTDEAREAPAEPEGIADESFRAQLDAVLRRFRCANCHSMDGAESAENSGPALWRRGSEDRPAFGQLYTREFFRLKVGDPRAFWPDTGMYYTPKRLKPTPEQLALLERHFFDESE